MNYCLIEQNSCSNCHHYSTDTTIQLVLHLSILFHCQRSCSLWSNWPYVTSTLIKMVLLKETLLVSNVIHIFTTFSSCLYMIPIDSHLLEKVCLTCSNAVTLLLNWWRTLTFVDKMFIDMFPCMELNLSI